MRKEIKEELFVCGENIGEYQLSQETIITIVFDNMTKGDKKKFQSVIKRIKRYEKTKTLIEYEKFIEQKKDFLICIHERYGMEFLLYKTMHTRKENSNQTMLPIDIINNNIIEKYDFPNYEENSYKYTFLVKSYIPLEIVKKIEKDYNFIYCDYNEVFGKLFTRKNN